jgi:Tfp pilus assembly ATPase PilU
MQTFDQALFDLYKAKQITYKDALKHADSPNDLRLTIQACLKMAQINLLQCEPQTLPLMVKLKHFKLRH